MSGMRFSAERRASRVIFSPTTEPIEPPMKAEVHDAEVERDPIEPAGAGVHRVGVTGLLVGRLETVGVMLETERILRAKVAMSSRQLPSSVKARCTPPP